MRVTSGFGTVNELGPFTLHIDILKKEVTLSVGNLVRSRKFTNKKDCWSCFRQTEKLISILFMFGEDH